MHQLARTSYKLACTSQRFADASAMFDHGGMASPSLSWGVGRSKCAACSGQVDTRGADVVLRFCSDVVEALRA